MNYIKQIIDYFFHHNISSDELKNKVYHRLVYPLKDENREEALKQIWDELEQADTVENDSWKQAFHRIQPVLDTHSFENNRKVRSYSRWMKIAAVWVVPFVMVCTSGYFYFSERPATETEGFSAVYLQHYAPQGTREKVSLPDGSEVWLNAGSTLIYPSSFSVSMREVHLIGEAFFDVQKDSLHPFIVNTHYLRMQVLGTTFNVSAYPDESQVEATLETGSLKVEVLGDTTSYYLSPDNQLVYIPSSRRVEKRKVIAPDFSDWRMGGLFFNNTPFEDVLRVLERTYGVEIYLRTSVYRNQKIYVHFNQHESIETIFRILELMIPELEYKISGKNVFIE